MKGAHHEFARTSRLSSYVLLGAILAAPANATERHCIVPENAAFAFDVSAKVSHRSSFGPNFVAVADASAVAQSACVLQKLAQQKLADIVEDLRQSTGVDPQIAVVLTTETLACGDLFYVSIANDIQGIGYRHQDPRDIFDDSPTSRLEGIAFLNDWPYWQRNAEEFAKAFNHEIGHRWSARVHTQSAGGESHALLGRQGLHWSYFLDTGGSPLEGNAWTLTDNETLCADTPFSLRSFSHLDLYLMGLLGAAEVPPWQMVTPSERGSDCMHAAVSAASPPQTCGPLDLPGQVETLSLDGVVAVEGVRNPPAESSPRAVDVAVVVLESADEVIDPDLCESLAHALDERFADFARATGGRLILRNVTTSERSCRQAFPAENRRETQSASGCQFAVAVSHRSAVTTWALLLMGLLRAARSRAVRRI